MVARLLTVQTVMSGQQQLLLALHGKSQNHTMYVYSSYLRYFITLISDTVTRAQLKLEC